MTQICWRWTARPEVSLWVDDSYPYLMLFSGNPLPDVRRVLQSSL